MADINELLAEEIVLELDGLKTLPIGSDEAATAVDNICKLNKMLQEDKKIEYDLDDKVSRRDLEKEKMQIESDEKSKSDKKEFIIKSIGFGIQLVGIVLPAVLYGNWMKRGFEFEQTGTIASKTFLGLTQKLKPTS